MVMTAASATSGSSPRNTQRQPNASATAPLMAGPMSPGSTHAVDITANMRGCSSAGYARPTAAYATAGMAPAADALHRARDDQHEHVRREPAREEPGREQTEADEKRPRRTLPVGVVPRGDHAEETAEEERAEYPTGETDVVQIVVDHLDDRRDRETLEADERHREDEPERERAPTRSPHSVGGRARASARAHRAPPPSICTSTGLLKISPPARGPDEPEEFA